MAGWNILVGVAPVVGIFCDGTAEVANRRLEMAFAELTFAQVVPHCGIPEAHASIGRRGCSCEEKRKNRSADQNRQQKNLSMNESGLLLIVAAWAISGNQRAIAPGTP
jgi:hypothetical protein